MSTSINEDAWALLSLRSAPASPLALSNRSPANLVSSASRIANYNNNNISNSHSNSNNNTNVCSNGFNNVYDGENMKEDDLMGSEPIAKLFTKDFEYTIQNSAQNKITIGRGSRTNDVDVNMGNSSFISRHHIEIHYDHPNFYLKCNGKNGIFIDGLFQRKTDSPLLLPKS